MSWQTLARRALAAPVSIVALLLAACGGTAACTGSVPSAESPMLDQVIALRLVGEDGAPIAVPAPGARATVIHFWSPGCAPCRSTIPAVLAKRRDLEAKGAQVLLVCALGPGEHVEDARAVLSLWGIAERFAVDHGGAAFAQIGARSLPAIAIVDAGGHLRWLAPDGVTASDIVEASP